MNSDKFLNPHSSFKNLIAYRVAECIFDITYYFANKYLGRGDRTVDQMIQAARSGKQNIAEGSAAATTSKETEIKLTNVAKASLQELLMDYEDYLRVRKLTQWENNDPRFIQTREVCRKHCDTEFFMSRLDSRSDETIANIAVILIKQCDFLLYRLLLRQQKNFLEQGGIREQMSQARRKKRGY